MLISMKSKLALIVWMIFQFHFIPVNVNFSYTKLTGLKSGSKLLCLWIQENYLPKYFESWFILLQNRVNLSYKCYFCCSVTQACLTLCDRIRVFSNESVLIRWLKYWSLSFTISLSNEYSGLISPRMDWLDLLSV